jgi:hypothetical protein
MTALPDEMKVFSKKPPLLRCAAPDVKSAPSTLARQPWQSRALIWIRPDISDLLAGTAKSSPIGQPALVPG